MKKDIVAWRESLGFPIDGAIWGFGHKLISSRTLGHCQTFQIDTVYFVDSRNRCALVFHYSLLPLLFFCISVLGNNLIELRILMSRKTCHAGNRCEQIGGKINAIDKVDQPFEQTRRRSSKAGQVLCKTTITAYSFNMPAYKSLRITSNSGFGSWLAFDVSRNWGQKELPSGYDNIKIWSCSLPLYESANLKNNSLYFMITFGQELALTIKISLKKNYCSSCRPWHNGMTRNEQSYYI